MIKSEHYKLVMIFILLHFING